MFKIYYACAIIYEMLSPLPLLLYYILPKIFLKRSSG